MGQSELTQHAYEEGRHVRWKEGVGSYKLSQLTRVRRTRIQRNGFFGQPDLCVQCGCCHSSLDYCH